MTASSFATAAPRARTCSAESSKALPAGHPMGKTSCLAAGWGRQGAFGESLLQEIPSHIDIKHIIELKQMGNRVKILIGNDMIPYDKVISNSHFTKRAS